MVPGLAVKVDGARRARGALAVAAAFLALLVLAACDRKPRAGEFCPTDEEGTAVCADATTALLCRGSRRIPLPCRGPRGCAGGGRGAHCDESIAREGDACDPKSEPSYSSDVDKACSEDKTRSLTCRDGKFVLDRLCRGPKGCDAVQIAGGSMRGCDRSLAERGDPCETRRPGGGSQEVGVCSVDRKSSLVCNKDEQGNFILGSVCTGPKGCRPGAPLTTGGAAVAVCDQSVAPLGGPCGKLDANRVSCTADGALVVYCEPATLKWTEHKKCAPKTRCVYQDRKVVVDGLECAPTSGQ